MKPDLEEENHTKDRISIMDVRNKNEGAKGRVKGVENDETSPESTGLFYKEILNQDELKKLKAEFTRLKNSCYLDHAGSSLYAESQINSHFSELQSNIYSNPHSRNPSSTITTDAIDFVRHKILRHFGTNADEYTVIFTSGATQALKLVAETFQFNGGLFAYLEECHTSVVGMREIVNTNLTSTTGDLKNEKDKPNVYCLSKYSLDKLMDPNFFCGSFCHKQRDSIHETSCCWVHRQKDHENSESFSEGECEDSTETLLMFLSRLKESSHKYADSNTGNEQRNALIAYPAQCNFSGVKYPLDWISPIKSGRLESISSVESFYIQLEKLINLRISACFDDMSTSSPEKPVNCRNHAEDDIGKESNYSISHSENNEQLPSVCINNNQHKWFVLLDAASYVATNVLDLSEYPADFVAVSFYKMFGFPTGLGALIVRNESAHVLKKQYFGGGTVNIAVPSQPFHVKRANLYERFEDGTIPFLSILAIRDGLDTLSRLCDSMDTIRERTFRLAQYFYKNLSSMHYGNGQLVAKIYSDTDYTSSKTQGPVVTFNLLRSDGSIIGYSEMEQIAYLHDVHLRYGCFCNPGACRRHLKLLPDEVIKQYEAGHVCGDLNDLIDGKPTGAIRVSVGYMTTQENMDFLLRLIYRCWIQPENFRERNENFPVSRPDILSVESTVGRNSFKERKLLRIFVYPIKSCAAFEVPKTWAIGPRGLLYDREWLIVNSAGVPLTQKREPRLCQLKPKIDISNRKLVLSIDGFPDVSISLEISQLQRAHNTLKAELCTSKVCGDTVMGLDCGDEVNSWLSDVLGRPGLKLIRMSPDHQRKPKNALDEISLANHSQFLLLSMGSLRRLAHQLIDKGVVSDLIPTWEETLALEGHEKGDQKQDQEQLEYKIVDNLIERLRGNLVVGCPKLGDNETGFEEEEWSEVRIGDLLFKSGGPCTRCATICTDQKTGERGPEPLLTLSAMRNGRANFGIHLYNIPDYSPTSVATTTVSASASLLPVDAQQSISPSWEEKVHIRTIKPWSGVDEPLEENGIATVPSGRYSGEKNKTPLEKLHGAFTETELQTSEAMMMEQAGAPKTVQNSGTKLKNRQLSSNSSSDSFTLSKSSSTKLANSSTSTANQVQAIHIGDPVSAQQNQRAVTEPLASTTSMTKIHTNSSSTNGQIHWSKNSVTNSATTTTPIAVEKSNSSPNPNGGVKTSISKKSFQISTPCDVGMEGNLAEMQSLIESID
ncbi:unnamed protein product [Orchesella dallaii]|uniref:Molybdenum cofactor sulfurase n=1 Tax=Orchesella dallaii TaxID=48710 RepID=A0ABP1QV82_9HEXA